MPESTIPATIRVVYLMEKNPETDSELCFAVFPDQIERDGFMMGYAHIGQHTPVHPDYVRAHTRGATESEYRELHRELTGIYHDCRLVQVPGRTIEYVEGEDDTNEDGSCPVCGYHHPTDWAGADCRDDYGAFMESDYDPSMTPDLWDLDRQEFWISRAAVSRFEAERREALVI